MVLRCSKVLSLFLSPVDTPILPDYSCSWCYYYFHNKMSHVSKSVCKVKAGWTGVLVNWSRSEVSWHMQAPWSYINLMRASGLARLCPASRGLFTAILAPLQWVIIDCAHYGKYAVNHRLSYRALQPCYFTLITLPFQSSPLNRSRHGFYGIVCYIVCEVTMRSHM